MIRNPKLKVSALNTLGRYLTGKSEAAGNAEFLLEHLDAFVTATLAPASRSALKQPYALEQKPDVLTMDVSEGERRLEATLLERYAQGSQRQFLPSVPNLIAYQVPLYAAKKRQGWGAIDLIGRKADDGYPVVIELKIKNGANVEPPLRAFVEALAYMIALKDGTIWRDFSTAWQQTTGAGKALPLPEQLTAVVIGTEAYWDNVREDRHQRGGLDSLTRLANACAARGFNFHWASVRATGKDTVGAWTILEDVHEVSLKDFSG